MQDLHQKQRNSNHWSINKNILVESKSLSVSIDYKLMKIWLGFFGNLRLTLSCMMLKTGKTCFKNLAVSHCKIFKVCLTIFQHYAWKG